jgi:hypothetical protein
MWRMRAYVARAHGAACAARHMHESTDMTNGDYNPFFRHEHLSNDARQTRYTMIALSVAAVVAIALIIATILSTRACSV